jgi:hypothetical protein
MKERGKVYREKRKTGREKGEEEKKTGLDKEIRERQREK